MRPPVASGRKRHPDFSMLLDGLVAEREQGITIDIAWRYFDTDTRRFVIIDPRPRAVHAQHGLGRLPRRRCDRAGRRAPRHQNADPAARRDPRSRRRQARRTCRQQDGTRRLVAGRVPQDRGRLPHALLEIRLLGRDAIPLSAVFGDNVSTTSKNMLGTPDRRSSSISKRCRAGRAKRIGFRLPVQTVLRDGQDFRGLAGTVTSGSRQGRRHGCRRLARRRRQGRAHRDDERRSRKRGCRTGDRAAARHRYRRVARRCPLVSRDAARSGANHRSTFRLAFGGCIQPGGRLSAAHVDRSHSGLEHRNQGAARSRNDGFNPARGCAANDIAIAKISLGRAAAIDVFSETPETGTLLLVDSVSARPLPAASPPLSTPRRRRPSRVTSC